MLRATYWKEKPLFPFGGGAWDTVGMENPYQQLEK